MFMRLADSQQMIHNCKLIHLHISGLVNDPHISLVAREPSITNLVANVFSSQLSWLSLGRAYDSGALQTPFRTCNRSR